ncbi:MAG: hypothetical protein ACTSYV_02465 [Candidatus Heimdallarchaeaceae archaeon]
MKLIKQFQNKMKKALDSTSRAQILSAISLIMIIIVLFSLSLTFKNLVSNWYWEQENIHFGWTHYNETGVTEVWEIEAYSDASYYYEAYLRSFRFENWNPYAGGDGPLNGYAYGPIFIYGLYIVSLFVSLFNPGLKTGVLVAESVKWTHITFDSLSVVMVYLIIISFETFQLTKVKKHIFGLLGAIVFLFMPINLLYVDCLYLNIPQMTFFTLLSFLFVLKRRYKTSAFFLSLAWLSKQMSLFFLIPWFLIIWKKTSLKKSLLEFLLPFTVITILISFPWIILSPIDYLWRVFGPGNPLNFVALDKNSVTVTLANSFLFLGNEDLANVYVQLNKFMIPFLFFYIIALLLSYFNGEKISKDETLFTVFTTWILFNVHVFISRGVYKYYNAFLTPFVVISFLLTVNQMIDSVSDVIFKRWKAITLKKESGKKRNIECYVHFSLVLVCFLALNTLFYYFNWVLIAKSRHLHPLYLLIFFVLFSMFIPSKIYKSLFLKSSYKMIKADTQYIITSTFQQLRKLLQRRGIRRKTKKEDKVKE